MEAGCGREEVNERREVKRRKREKENAGNRRERRVEIRILAELSSAYSIPVIHTSFSSLHSHFCLLPAVSSSIPTLLLLLFFPCSPTP